MLPREFLISKNYIEVAGSGGVETIFQTFLINCCFFVCVIDCKGGLRTHIIENIIF